MHLEERASDGLVLLKLIGRLDSSTTTLLQDRLAEILTRKPRRLVLDFSRLDYINSTGLRVLLTTAKQLRADNAEFLLCGLLPAVREVLQVSGFHKIIATVEDCGAFTEA